MSGSLLNVIGSSPVLNTVGRVVYQLAFQISPIIFTNGIAGNYGGMLPLYPILAPSLLSITDLDDYFAHFDVMPGGKLANYTIGQYPFANQSVAANAIIAEPLNVSMRMRIPVKDAGGHAIKLAAMMALQQTIQQHANLGGTYTIATPACISSNWILTGLTDISPPVSETSPVPQWIWQWDFVQSLVTLQQAQSAQSTFMDKISNGLPNDGTFAATATQSAIPSVTTGTTAAGVGVPGGVTGAIFGGSNAAAPSVSFS